MNKLRELAIVCAKRPDVLLQIYEGYACMYVGVGPERGSVVAKCDDDDAISRILYELNSGKYTMEKKREHADTFYRKAA